MRGRKPVPVEQKIINGNPGQRALPEPLLVGGRPTLEQMGEPPEWLPSDAKDFWRESIARLIEVGIIDMVDMPALEMLAVAYARWRTAAKVIASEGFFTMAGNKNLRVHPAIKIEREANAMFMKMAEHFALTPVSRTRLGMAELHAKSLAMEIKDTLSGADDSMDVIDVEPG